MPVITYDCNQCNGSGEGMYDGSKCSKCNGMGDYEAECDGDCSTCHFNDECDEALNRILQHY